MLCRGDVWVLNVLVTETGRVGFTDFDGAFWGPALVDLVMIRHQWFMGAEPHRLLSVSEAVEAVQGYWRERPLSEQEQAAFPVVWAAFQVDRFSFLLQKWGEKTRRKPFRGWRVQEELLSLPDCALESGRDWIGQVNKS